jgi:membrane protease YdiL (CAAX protease family)
MASPPATREVPWNTGQMIAWVLLLFVFTILGALPLLLEGLTLSTISQSTPHLPLVMTGMLVTSCAPTLAAIFVAGLYPGAGGVRSIFRQARIWRVGLMWYAAALIGPIILFLIVEALNALGRGGLPAHWIAPSFGGPGGLYFVIFGSLLAEEPGWRGFAQPRLQARYGALAAAILIGVLWSTWHLWYVITPGGFANVTGADAAATYIRLTSTAVIYAWMYNSTNGSLLIAMLAHVGHNLAAGLMPSTGDGGWRHLTIALAYFAVALTVVFMTDRRTLRRRARARTNEETVRGQGSAG